MTPAQRHGLKVGDKVRVMTKDFGGTIRFEQEGFVGQVLTLTEDDGTSNPYFVDSNDKLFCPNLGNLTKIEEAPMTPAMRAGIAPGVECTFYGDHHALKPGDVVVIHQDDGSNCPFFRRVSDGLVTCSWIKSEDHMILAPNVDHPIDSYLMVTEDMRPMFSEGSIVKKVSHMQYKLISGFCGYNNMSDGSAGAFLSERDNRLRPLLDSEVQQVLELEKSAEGFENANHEEEEDMFNDQTPAQRAGLTVGDRVEVIDGSHGDEDLVGKRMVLSRDDGSSCPYFEEDNGNVQTPWLSNVRKVDDLDEDLSKHSDRVIRVGDPVRIGDILIDVNGDTRTADANRGPDGDDEYSVEGGYIHVDRVITIVRPEPKNVDLTIEVSERAKNTLSRSGGLLVKSEIDDCYSDDFREAIVEVVHAIRNQH